MLGFFERQRLVKKGLATAKLRRRRSESELRNTLEYGLIPKSLILSAFLAGLSLLVYSPNTPQPTVRVLIAILISFTALVQLWITHPKTLAKNSRLTLLSLLFLLHLALVKFILTTAHLPNDPSHLLRSFDDPKLWILALPLAFAPLATSVLLGSHHGIYATIFVSLWSALLTKSTDPVLLVMSLVCGFVSVFATLHLRRWTQLLRAGVLIGVATLLLSILFDLVGPWASPTTHSIPWRHLASQSAVAIGSGLLTALLALLVIPVLQSIFQVATDLSWIELSDLNHPLLKRLNIEAPGTYHHSLFVANLAEAAAEAIGANPTMCRACAYFHDIGKLVKPDYFTENMRNDRNPHDELAPTMSALIILAHVKEGVDLALHHRLHQEVIDVIQQHHGTSKVSFFYQRALQQQEDARAGSKIMNLREADFPEVREESFRYPGPRPQTREGAILSLADSIESASRCLERVTPQKIDQMVNSIIHERMIDGQFKECDLTMRALEEIAESFKHTLQSILHSRVAYPSTRTERKEFPRPSSPPVAAR